MLDILKWVLVVEILGLAVAPALRAFFANRRDAALLSRPLGLVLVGWLAWALSLVTPLGFSRGAILVAVALVAAISFLAGRRAGVEAGPSWGAEENRAALFFWVPAAIFLVVRAAVPEILGAEKFMDLAFLNSLTRWSDMPPLDPWMSEKSINYYYWGYLLVAAAAKAAGITPFVAYNLAIATFAGYSFAAAACLGFRLSRGKTSAAVAAGFISVFAGNLTGAFDAWARPFARDFDYWHASRVIGAGDTINEFPFFTFFHADLHPHLLAFPFFLAAFAVADRWIELGIPERREGLPKPREGAWAVLSAAAPIFLVGVVASTAVAANLWNAPAIAVLLVIAGVARTTRGERFPGIATGLLGALTGFAVFVGALVLTWPYRTSYQLPYNGLGRTHAVSGLVEFLGVWGILLGVAAVALLALTSSDTEAGRRRRDFLLAVAGAASVLIALVKRGPAFAPLVFLACLAGAAAWRSLSRHGDREGLFAAFLALLGLAMIAGCEVVYFKDNYGEQLHRMNTIFKFYHQAWPLVGIAAAVFADRAWRARERPRPSVVLAVVLGAFAAVLYPATAIGSRLRQHSGPFTLDSRVALERRNHGDLEMIEWLRRNAEPGTVLMEASGDPYSEYARISSHTGIPSVLGWANHEGLWRSNDENVRKRLDDIRAFYTATSAPVAEDILRRYRVTYVIVGDLERTAYGGAPQVPAFPFLQRIPGGPAGIFRLSK